MDKLEGYTMSPQIFHIVNQHDSDKYQISIKTYMDNFLPVFHITPQAVKTFSAFMRSK